MRECHDFGRMVVTLDAPHDAIALVVEPLGGEHAVGFADGRFVHLLQRAHELVEARLARPADGEVPIVARQHVGFHQLVVAQMCGHMRVPEVDDAVCQIAWRCPSMAVRSLRIARNR